MLKEQRFPHIEVMVTYTTRIPLSIGPVFVDEVYEPKILALR